MLSKIKYKIGKIIQRVNFSPIKYWEERAKNYGELSVLNLNHKREEMQAVKDFQIKIIFPLLKRALNGSEKSVLDFGCGPGRFTIELAEVITGKAVGVDPIEHLIQLAPKNENVSYKKITNNTIPANDKSFDIVWICLVLGGLVSRRQLNRTVKEINRIANDNALLFLVENTTSKKNNLSWKYRSIERYIHLFKNFGLVHLADYDDLGERNSIFAGRKK